MDQWHTALGICSNYQHCYFTAISKKNCANNYNRLDQLRLQDFDVNIEHRSEHRMAHVDALSRAPTENQREVEPTSLRIDKADIAEDDWLFSMQLQDYKFREMVKKLHWKDKQVAN